MEDRASLAEIKRVLAKRGVFVIDVFNREELTQKYERQKPTSQTERIPSFFLQQKRTISPKGDWLCDLWTIQDKVNGQTATFEHSVRLYERSELRACWKTLVLKLRKFMVVTKMKNSALNRHGSSLLVKRNEFSVGSFQGWMVRC